MVIFYVCICTKCGIVIRFKISEEAAEFLVEHYHRLRQRDSSGVTNSSWRITVRQLESMIRLSEAMAKMYCSDEVCMYNLINHILT